LNKLPDREDFEHLELYSKEVIPRIDDKLVDIMYKLQLCEGEFLERKTQNTGHRSGFLGLLMYIFYSINKRLCREERYLGASPKGTNEVYQYFRVW
jgi:hypothetical protein